MYFPSIATAKHSSPESISNDIYAEILTLTYFPIIPLSTTTGYSIYSSISSTTSCTTNSRSVSWALFGVQAHVPEIKIFTKTRFSNHYGKGETGWGTSLQGFLWPRCSRPSTPATQQSSIGCSGDWTAHDGCHGAGGERNHLHFNLQPNLGVDDEGLHAQVLLDGLQAPGHGVGTLHYP